MGNRFQDKCGLIVGGTTGMGLAAGRRFLEEGARLILAGRSAEKGHAALEQLRSLGEVHFVACDAQDPAQVVALFEKAEVLLGRLDYLYHVAGISGRRFGDGPLDACTEAGWDITLQTNLKSVFLTNQLAVRHFLANRRPGAILNMASVLGFSPSPRYFDTCAYAASKGGIIALSKQAAARYASEGIRVNVIAPSLIETPMAARACQDEEIRAFLRTKQPLRQGPGQPEDCTEAALFLCSDEARFITGVVLNVDGGWCVSEGQYPPQMPNLEP